MIGRPPSILFRFGTVAVHTYGVIIAGAVLVAWLWAERRAARHKLPLVLTNDVFFWAVIGGFLGARLGFVIQQISYYQQHWLAIFAIWQGGLSFHGGLVGGTLAAWIVLRSHKSLRHFWPLADAISAPLLVAAAIGRLGNWVNQELYGYPTHVPWAITIDAAHRLPGYVPFSSFHPTFAYELLLNLVGAFLIIWVIERLPRPFAGRSFSFALGWYGIARGITEIWRISDRIVGPFSLAQIVSILLIVGAIRLAAILKAKPLRHA